MTTNSSLQNSSSSSFSKLWNYIVSIFAFRSVYKYILHLLTGKCELVRICSGGSEGKDDIDAAMKRQFAFERCIYNSKTLPKELFEERQMYSHIHQQRIKVYHLKRDLATVDDVYKCIDRIKSIDAHANEKEKRRIRQCIRRMLDYRTLTDHLTSLRQESFNEQNDEHHSLLRLLWKHFGPLGAGTSQESGGKAVQYARRGKHWKTIGWQGVDPVTDLRGAGVLALRSLAYFGSQYRAPSSSVFKIAADESKGFGFAIAGVSFTAALLDYMEQGTLAAVFYRQVHHLDQQAEEDGERAVLLLEAGSRTFHELFCKVFVLFGVYWRMEGADQMQFEQKQREFFLTHIEDHFLDGQILSAGGGHQRH